MTERGVLILNQNYEPLHVCAIGRAVALVEAGKAEIVVAGDRPIRTPSALLLRPSVIKLQRLVRRPWVPVRVTRREVFMRDDYTCQYCGRRARDLTLDHVIPRCLGGTHVWENVVSACRACNHRKGGKRLADTRMRLAREPKRPVPGQYLLWTHRADEQSVSDWSGFIGGA